MLGLPLSDPSIPFSAEDRALSVKMMAYWTNFAKTGSVLAYDVMNRWATYFWAILLFNRLELIITSSFSYLIANYAPWIMQCIDLSGSIDQI